MQNEEIESWQDEANRRLGERPKPGDVALGDLPQAGSAPADNEACWFQVYNGSTWTTHGHCSTDTTGSSYEITWLGDGVDTPGTYEPPAWKLSMVEIREQELEGLDRAGFRDLVRGKLQVVGDDLLRHWEEWNAAG